MVLPQGQVFKVESTSALVDLAQNSPWSDYPGLTLDFNQSQGGKVLILAQGNVEGAAGLCEAAYRLKVNGTALGDSIYGQAASSSDVASGSSRHWAKGWSIAHSYTATGGAQSISVQMRNARGTTSTCRWQPGTYGMGRLVAVRLDPQNLFTAATDATTINSATGDLAWKTAATAQLTVPAGGAQVLFIGNATGQATSGICHATYTFNVDGVRAGHSVHGLGINVSYSGTIPFGNTTTLHSQALTAGDHTVDFQVANTGSGNCAWPQWGSRVVAVVL
jgi:hypothetical protein